MTVKSEYTVHPSGAVDMVNLLVADSGAMVRIEAEKNAVIVQMIEAPQEDGTMQYRRIVSIECKDPEMMDVLREQALDILRGRG